VASVAQEYGRFDASSCNADVGVEDARQIASRFELRAGAADEAASRNACLDLLAIRPGERVLEVGCGSGAVLRELARRVRPSGTAVGLDFRPSLLAVAREYVEEAGLDSQIELHEGDARSLPFADATFDAALAVTTLCHISGAEDAIGEMIRVVRPGGRIGIYDRDPDSFVIWHPDRVLTRRIVAAFSDQAHHDAWLGRRGYGLLVAAGLEQVAVRAFTAIEHGTPGFYDEATARAANIAVKVGAISEQDGQSWLETLRTEREAGRWLAGMTHLFLWGTRR
jgi:ubiquinone/menaquinone biosynthesis C-methylase UbiE